MARVQTPSLGTEPQAQRYSGTAIMYTIDPVVRRSRRAITLPGRSGCATLAEARTYNFGNTAETGPPIWAVSKSCSSKVRAGCGLVPDTGRPQPATRVSIRLDPRTQTGGLRCPVKQLGARGVNVRGPAAVPSPNRRRKEEVEELETKLRNTECMLRIANKHNNRKLYWRLLWLGRGRKDAAMHEGGD